jgi:hypothetical protein
MPGPEGKSRDLPPTQSIPLANKKQELFARFVAGGEILTRAYELAGYSPNTGNASNLAKREDVAERIEVLKMEHERKEIEFRLAKQQLQTVAGNGSDEEIAEAAQIVVWTADKVREMLAENARLAQIAGEYKAATEALKLIGQSLHMFDKVEADGRNTPPAQVSLTLVSQVLDGTQEPGGISDPDGNNPLAPRLRSARPAE